MCAADTGAAMVANMDFANRFDGRIPAAGVNNPVLPISLL
jgi:hypothetical protein